MPTEVPEPVADYLSEIGRKGGSKSGPTKVRGDKTYYAKIGEKGRALLAQKNMPPIPKYSISILAHQNLALTKKCIASVLQHSADFGLILTDNGCTDGTREYFDQVAASQENVTVFHYEKNLGFIEPNRVAFRNSRSPFHVLLNNDSVVLAGWLDRLHEPFTKDPKCALVGIVGTCCQLRGDFRGENGPRFEYVEGSIMMMDRVKVLEIEPHLFPPELVGAYGEDSYLSLRMREAGYNLHRVQMTFVHYRGATSAIVPQAKAWEQSNHQFLLKRFKRYMINHRFDYPTIVKRRDAMGDVLLATAILRALKKENPLSPIHFETILPQMLAGNPDVAYVAQNVVQAMDARLINLNGISEMHPKMNIIDAYAKMAGLTEYERKCHFHVPQGDLEWAQRTLGDKAWTVIHPGPSWRDKTWPLPRWNELIEKIGGNVVVVGSEPNGPMSSTLDLRGKTNIGQLAAIIKLCRLFVGIDSLPIHLAQALGIPVVGLFGTTRPDLILNEGSSWRAVASSADHPGTGLRHAVAGKTYVECPQGNPMDTIEVKAVLAAIEGLS